MPHLKVARKAEVKREKNHQHPIPKKMTPKDLALNSIRILRF